MLIAAFFAASCHHPAPPELPTSAGTSYSVTREKLAGLPKRTVRVTRKGGKSVEYEGVAVFDFLRHVGVAPKQGKPDLRTGILVEAGDGYSVLLSMGEVDTGLRQQAPILTTSYARGPDAEPREILLLVPDDRLPSRSVQNVVRLRVIRLD